MKQIPWARIAVSVFFVGLLATPAVLRWRLAQRTAAARTTLDRQAALARHGFYLEEVSRAAGIDFVHQAPTLDAKLNPIMPEVASMGASVSIVDFDRDGWPDIYVTNSAEGSKNHLLPKHARWHVQRCGRGTWHCGCESTGHRRFDGSGVGRLRQ